MELCVNKWRIWNVEMLSFLIIKIPKIKNNVKIQKTARWNVQNPFCQNNATKWRRSSAHAVLISGIAGKFNDGFYVSSPIVITWWEFIIAGAHTYAQDKTEKTKFLVWVDKQSIAHKNKQKRESRQPHNCRRRQRRRKRRNTTFRWTRFVSDDFILIQSERSNTYPPKSKFQSRIVVLARKLKYT